jgi:acetyltransferase-like isoleucine patch superfamily enzyme
VIDFLNKRFPQYQIGDYTYGEDPIIFDWNEGSTLKIGKFCSIGTRCVFMLGGNHNNNRISTYPFHKLMMNIEKLDRHTNGDVVIKDDCWLGNFSCFLSGVTVGEGSIVGALSVVRRDVRPYSVVIGNPSIEIRRRFSDSDIEKLLELKWWNWDSSKIKKNWKLIIGKDIDALIEKGRE